MAVERESLRRKHRVDELRVRDARRVRPGVLAQCRHNVPLSTIPSFSPDAIPSRSGVVV